MKIKIALLMPDDAARKSFITPDVIKGLNNIGDVVINNAGYESEIIAELLEDADVAITGWGCPAFDSAMLSKANRLKLLAHTGGSVAALVTPELYDKGITVISGNKLFAESVAEGTVAYMMTGLRRIPYYAQNIQKGLWRSGTFDNRGLLDRKVGLVGYGAITQALIPMLRPFRNDIMVYSSHLTTESCKELGVRRAESMEEIFSSNDIISLHMARTPQTYHIVDKHLLSLMPDGALLINTARGSVIDEYALACELHTGRIHAVLDVFEQEPLPIDSALRGMDNAVLLPHMAGPTGDRHERISFALIDDITRFFNDETLVHVIDKSYAIRMTNDALKFPKSES